MTEQLTTALFEVASVFKGGCILLGESKQRSASFLGGKGCQGRSSYSTHIAQKEKKFGVSTHSREVCSPGNKEGERVTRGDVIVLNGGKEAPAKVEVGTKLAKGKKGKKKT